ncbi:MAG: YopX family protein [Candidatus Nanoarchaeia archaeon]|jgi:uncharacterized phage protein (TIGR01671 family)|nr:YopX family protein [Candidatus Nanoarchaeia archaeon]
MRDLKFRAWDKKKNIFAEHIEIYYDGSFNIGYVEDSYSGLEYDDDKDAILMQYTGVNDKNGKEIYEGDIVLVSQHYEGDYFSPEQKIVVKYEDGDYGRHINSHSVYNYNIIIVGNIYENPELGD